MIEKNKKMQNPMHEKKAHKQVTEEYERATEELLRGVEKDDFTSQTDHSPQQAATASTHALDSSTRFMLFVLIGLLIILGAIISITYWYEPTQAETSYLYNGYTFLNITGLWYTTLHSPGTNTSYNVPLHFGPRQVEMIPVMGNIREIRDANEIFITFDPAEKTFTYVALSASELSINLAQTLGITPIAACTKNETLACQARPIVTCDTKNATTIYLKQSNDTRITLSGTCITVEGDGMNLVRATDRLILGLFGIIRK